MTTLPCHFLWDTAGGLEGTYVRCHLHRRWEATSSYDLWWQVQDSNLSPKHAADPPVGRASGPRPIG